MAQMDDTEISRLLQAMNSDPIIEGTGMFNQQPTQLRAPTYPSNQIITGGEVYSQPAPLPDVQYQMPLALIPKPLNFPDISFTKQIPIKGDFSLFIDKHKECASKLIDILMDCENKKDLLIMSNWVKPQVNPDLFHYCLGVVYSHRDDTKELKSNVFTSFLSKFINDDAFQETRRAMASPPIISMPGVPQSIIIESEEIMDTPITGDENDGEARVAYFREDLGVNLHHHHWHSVYVTTKGKYNFVEKDRRGELFYYMHHQMLARYDAERLCNRLPRVEPFDTFRVATTEGYYSKLIGVNSSKIYPGRPSGIAWADINRPGMTEKISDLTECVSRILQAIDEGSVITNQRRKIIGESFVTLRQDLTIDILGNMIEPSDLSPNREFYGKLHTYGHLFAACVHDPEFKHRENMGVMADVATAVRDPLFFRWHKYVDTFFDRFKASKRCPMYTEKQLRHPFVSYINFVIKLDENYKNTLINKDVHTFSNELDLENHKPNELKTFRDYTAVRVNGLDLVSRTNVNVEMKHLNYWPFSYEISAMNIAGKNELGTVRIFLAPKYDNRGQRFKLNEQRSLFIEMDRFLVNMHPGLNVYRRQSIHSSVTIPFSQTFPATNDFNSRFTQPVSDYCSCGWPQHMLLPRGTKHGDTYQMFVMISKDASVVNKSSAAADICQSASSFCGLRNQKYPDSRDMGFPFDRPFDGGKHEYIESFVQSFDANGANFMSVKDVTIRYIESNKKIRSQNTFTPQQSN